jgi:cell wall-associated NlpC family hydrolase
MGGGGSRRSSSAGIGSIIPAGLPRTSDRTTTTSASAARVLNTADDYLGVKYVWGGTSPNTGFDCSGFVQYVFAKHGVQLPRTSRQQATVGTRLPAEWSSVSAGDLVMFEEGGRIGHVAIYAGNDRIIHATSSGGKVRYDDLRTQRGQWFVDHMVAARRVTPDARGLLLDLAKGFAAGMALELDPGDHAPKPNR